MKPLQVADVLAVQALVARAALVADRGTLDEYRSVYAEDAVWDLPGAVNHGLEEILAAAAERRRAGTTGPTSGTHHIVSIMDTLVDGGIAMATTCWMYYVDTATAPRLARMGWYDDEMRRTGHGWRIAVRRITPG
jgi:3-phenylpropionate/cinnamic acid dioxygenase small subunit